MQVSEVLANPGTYLGQRVSVEGSVHYSDFPDMSKHVWLSDLITSREEACWPESGLLVMYPGIRARFIPQRSGPQFPFVGFECKGILIRSPIAPCSYALMDLSSVRYKHLSPDEWLWMNLRFVPDRRYLQDILAFRSSDEAKIDAILQHFAGYFGW